MSSNQKPISCTFDFLPRTSDVCSSNQKPYNQRAQEGSLSCNFGLLLLLWPNRSSVPTPKQVGQGRFPWTQQEHGRNISRHCLNPHRNTSSQMTTICFVNHFDDIWFNGAVAGGRASGRASCSTRHQTLLQTVTLCPSRTVQGTEAFFYGSAAPSGAGASSM
jgi:hypothetical protein